MELNAEHQRMLTVESGISDEVIAARGYETVTTKSRIKALGFSDRQARVPSLLIPMWNIHGEVGLYHIRPESPRIVNGKPHKYEFPRGSRMALDVPPTVRHHLGSPTMPLWITEGSKKADALATLGCCVVGVIGVWNWRGTNGEGGTTALGDWESIAFNNRQVYIVFDSDVMTKIEVYQALERLREFLKRRGAKVLLVYLPSGEGGQKVGVDDFLVAGHSVDDLVALASPHLRPAPTQPGCTQGPYRATPQGLVRIQQTEGGDVREIPLSNFTATIRADIKEDDGIETRRMFELEATLVAEKSRFSVSAVQFGPMNWVIEQLGAQAIIYPGFSTRDHTRTAIQTLSTHIEKRSVYTHIGWRQLATKEWAYLHAEGAIGQKGQLGQESGIEVSLSAGHARYVLPAPGEGAELIEAIRASLRMLDLAPAAVVYPVWGGIWAAVQGDTNYCLALVGQTGVFKTEIAALVQQHFGRGMNATHLPGSWLSTPNALEAQCFTAKDAVTVIDDYAPTGSIGDQQKLQAAADRLLRGQGNQSGRARMRADATLRPTKSSRGLILLTGEDVPRGASLRARALVSEVGPIDVNKERLTECQKDAANGLYDTAMAGFLQWMAPQMDNLRGSRPEAFATLRQAATQEHQHGRTADIVASLMYGVNLFCTFAVSVGAISEPESEQLKQNAWEALRDVAAAQQSHQGAQDPARRFLELITAALSNGNAHLKIVEETEPSVRRPSLGYQLIVHTTGTFNLDEEWRPLGKAIGWIDDEDVFFEPTTSFAAAQALGRDSHDTLTVTQQTLWKRLKDENLLQSVDQTRNSNIVRKTLDGVRRNVIHLHARALWDIERPIPPEPDQPDQTDHTPGETDPPVNIPTPRRELPDD